MVYQSKKAVNNEGFFDLFEIKSANGLDGKSVDILQPIGQTKIKILEAQKAQLQKSIADIDEKIAAINSLNV